MWRTRPFLSHRTTSPGEASVFEDPEGNLIKKRTDSNGHCPNSKTGLFLKIKSLHVLKTLFSPVKLTSCSLFEVLPITVINNNDNDHLSFSGISDSLLATIGSVTREGRRPPGPFLPHYNSFDHLIFTFFHNTYCCQGQGTKS